jgi:hypothetical protein
MEMDIPLKDRNMQFIYRGIIGEGISHPLPGGFSTVPGISGINMTGVDVE